MSPIAQVVVDWSRISDARGEGLDSFTGFVEWVRSAPQARAVHVVVPSLVARRSQRNMKNMLQALGCTVTLRTHLSAPQACMLHGTTPGCIHHTSISQ